MGTAARTDSFLNFNFLVEIDGISRGTTRTNPCVSALRGDAGAISDPAASAPLVTTTRSTAPDGSSSMSACPNATSG